MKTNFVMACLCLSLWASAQGPKALPECAGASRFLVEKGFNTQRTAFSTSDRGTVGLVCYELPTTPNGPITKTFSHPTWSDAGYLAPIAIDKSGGVYVGPAPMVNTLKNAPEKQNVLWRVNPNTAVMSPMIDLPRGGAASPQNPYGLMGLAYDCESSYLYATSLAGSDMNTERGMIFSLKCAPDGKVSVIDTLTGIDAMGIGVGYFDGKKRVFYGHARSCEVYSIEIGSDGKFVGEASLVCSLANLGLRGDDRARKIRFSQDGKMVIKGVEFYYNLIAPTEKQESTYTFRYDAEKKIWVLEGVH